MAARCHSGNAGGAETAANRKAWGGGRGQAGKGTQAATTRSPPARRAGRPHGPQGTPAAPAGRGPTTAGSSGGRRYGRSTRSAAFHPPESLRCDPCTLDGHGIGEGGGPPGTPRLRGSAGVRRAPPPPLSKTGHRVQGPPGARGRLGPWASLPLQRCSSSRAQAARPTPPKYAAPQPPGTCRKETCSSTALHDRNEGFLFLPGCSPDTSGKGLLPESPYTADHRGGATSERFQRPSVTRRPRGACFLLLSVSTAPRADSRRPLGRHPTSTGTARRGRPDRGHRRLGAHYRDRAKLGRSAASPCRGQRSRLLAGRRRGSTPTGHPRHPRHVGHQPPRG